jgi:hypothetical protein
MQPAFPPPRPEEVRHLGIPAKVIPSTNRRSATTWMRTAVTTRLTPVSILLFPVQLFLGLGWIRAGVEKLISPAWWDGSALTTFLEGHADTTIGFMATVSSTVFAPLAIPISLLVMFTQPLIGFSLITHRAMRLALWWGITLNVVFVLMGAVTPSAFYLVIELALLTAVDLGLLGHSPRTPNPKVAVLWAAVALGAAPYVTTLAPAKVIEDPGIMIVTISAIAAATETLRLLAGRLELTSDANGDVGQTPPSTSRFGRGPASAQRRHRGARWAGFAAVKQDGPWPPCPDIRRT